MRDTVMAGVFACALLGCAAEPGVSRSPLEFSCAAFPRPVRQTDLVERFGAEAVVVDSIVGADDGPFLGTVVHPRSPERTFEVAWSAADRQAAAWMRVRATGSSWATAGGLRIGQDLRAVEEANGGRPFRLRGFAGEGNRGGSVLSWGGGSLGTERAAGSCEELVRFQPDWDADVADVVRQVMFERDVSSAHPAMREVNPRIVELWLMYPGGAP